jgi:hypothetical protein
VRGAKRSDSVVEADTRSDGDWFAATPVRFTRAFGVDTPCVLYPARPNPEVAW